MQDKSEVCVDRFKLPSCSLLFYQGGSYSVPIKLPASTGGLGETRGAAWEGWSWEPPRQPGMSWYPGRMGEALRVLVRRATSTLGGHAVRSMLGRALARERTDSASHRGNGPGVRAGEAAHFHAACTST